MTLSNFYFWITLVLSVATGVSEVLFKTSGQVVEMKCGKVPPNTSFQWKHKDILVISIDGKSGRTMKGNGELSKRAKLHGSNLHISSVDFGDSGVYSCFVFDITEKKDKLQMQYTLYIVSVSASPSKTVLHSTQALLTCDIFGESGQQVQWLKPDRKPYGGVNKTIKLHSVTSADSGQWTCQITYKGKVENIMLDLSVVGPLMSPANVTYFSGESAELPCFYNSSKIIQIVGGGWERVSPSGISLLKLVTANGGLHWSSSDGLTSKVKFTDQQLSTKFNVVLENVEPVDAGVYRCTLMFDFGKNLSTETELKIIGNGVISTPENGVWQMQVFGMKLWILTALVSIFLVFLVITIVLVHCRNKRLKSRARTLKSTKQPLAARNFCRCNRPVREPDLGRKAKTSSLPRNQYIPMN